VSKTASTRREAILRQASETIVPSGIVNAFDNRSFFTVLSVFTVDLNSRKFHPNWKRYNHFNGNVSNSEVVRTDAKSNQEKWRSNYEGEEGLEVAEVSDGGADFLLPGERLAAELLRFGGGGGVVAWELISESIRLTQPIFEKQNQINSNQIGEYLIKKREKWCDSGTRTECLRERERERAREREREVVIGSWKWETERRGNLSLKISTIFSLLFARHAW